MSIMLIAPEEAQFFSLMLKLMNAKKAIEIGMVSQCLIRSRGLVGQVTD